jgi:hypothetical protein
MSSKFRVQPIDRGYVAIGFTEDGKNVILQKEESAKRKGGRKPKTVAPSEISAPTRYEAGGGNGETAATAPTNGGSKPREPVPPPTTIDELTPHQAALFQVIRDSGRDLKVSEICEAAEVEKNQLVYNDLGRLHEWNFVEKAGRGVYRAVGA